MRFSFFISSRLILSVSVVLGVLLFCSCSSTKNVKYFQDLSDSAKYLSITRSSFVDPVIQPDDIMSVIVQTIDPQTSVITNQGTMSANNVGSSLPGVNGYLVDKDGNIELPLVGVVKIGGLTTSAAKQLIHTKAELFYKNPIVQVRFANFKITIIGEVARPSTYTMPNEKVTILDALGVAGDLTIYGKRENILLTRSLENGKQEFVRLDLNSSEIFSSPYFYLKQNDVIYVEPNKAKLASTDASKNRMIALTGTALSVIIVIISRLL